MNWRNPGPFASLALGVFAVSFAGVLGKACESPAIVISFWRVAFACAVLLPFLLQEPRSEAGALPPPSDPGVRTLPATVVAPGTYEVRAFPAFLRGHPMRTVVVAGGLLALHFVLWFESLKHTSVASSTLLVTTQPIWAALLSPLLLREKPSARVLGAMSLTFVGVAFLMGADFSRAQHTLKGDLLSLVAAMLSAAYLVLGRGLRRRWPLVRYFFVVTAVAGVVLGLVGAIARGSLAFPARDFVWLFLLGAIPHVAGHGMLNRAVRHFPVFVVNLAGVGEAVLGAVWGALFFHEPIRASLFLAGLLIFGGVVLALRASKPAP